MLNEDHDLQCYLCPNSSEFLSINGLSLNKLALRILVIKLVSNGLCIISGSKANNVVKRSSYFAVKIGELGSEEVILWSTFKFSLCGVC